MKLMICCLIIICFYSYTRYNDRMLIPDKTTRSYLRSFAKSEYGISREELVVLRQKVIDVSPCLLPLLPDAEIHEMEGKVQNIKLNTILLK